MGRLSGTVTFITGASAGLGAAIAREAARRGGDVVLTARRQEQLESLSAEIEGMGRRALAVKCDVTQDGDLERATAEGLDVFGRINHVIANAGFGVVGPFEKMDLEDFRRQFETNVFGVLRTVLATREHLMASRGCLAIIGSMNGCIPMPGSSPYCMSKFAVHALASSLWYELRPYGVAVVLVATGFFKSEIRQIDNRGVRHPHAKDQIPAWLSMSSEKAARQVVRAVHKRQRFKVITGHAKIAVFLQRYCPPLSYMLLFALTRRRRKKMKMAASS